MVNVAYPHDPASLPDTTEVADFSTADHDFLSATYAFGAAKGILITAPSAGGNVILRFLNDTEDRTLTYPAGTHYLPVRVRFIRNSGTTVTQVVGLME